MRLILGKITILSLLLVAVGCNNYSYPVKEATMTEILSDAMILEAGNQLKYNYLVLPDSIWKDEYLFILKKYNVSKSDFETTMESYKHDGTRFSGLIEKVIDHLQRQELKRNPSKK